MLRRWIESTERCCYVFDVIASIKYFHEQKVRLFRTDFTFSIEKLIFWGFIKKILVLKEPDEHSTLKPMYRKQPDILSAIANEISDDQDVLNVRSKCHCFILSRDF